MQRLLITCGGTGGHFFPGLSIARTLKKQGGEVLLLLSGSNAIQQSAIARKFEIPVVELAPMPTPTKPKNIFKFVRGLVSGMVRARREIRDFAPQAVLGMGSFASTPVLLTALFAHAPIYLHDGNARVGKANRWFSRAARFMGTAFPAVNAGRVKCPCEDVGMPIRPEILNAPQMSRAEAIAELNRRFETTLSPDRITILVMGGSQGAATLNSNVPAGLHKLGDRNFQLLHLAGPGKIEEVRAAYAKEPFPALALPGTDAMEIFMQAADLVIARSGGSSCAELAFFGKPALLVPYPYAAEGHQWDNARHFVNAGAALAVDNSACTPEYVAETLTAFLDNPEDWARKGKAMHALARPEASETMLRKIFGQP